MAFFLLLVSVVTAFTFGQLFKWSQRQGCHGPVVVTINYTVVALILALYLGLQGSIELTPMVLQVGVVTGCCFTIAMFLMTWALKVSNVAAILTAFRVSIVVPIAMSYIIWQEEVTSLQLIGIAMALGALLLMGGGQGNHITKKALFTHGGLAVAVCIMQGVSHTSARWVHHAGLDDFHAEVLLVTATTAAVFGAMILVALQRRPNSSAVRMGTIIGVFNTGALLILLASLARFKSATFFPITGCAIVILDNIFAHVVWREQLSVLAWIGAGIGAASILLVM